MYKTTKQKRAYLTKQGTIKVTFPYHNDTLHMVRNINERTYDKQTKSWYIPYTLNNCFTLKKNHFILSEALKKKANADWATNIKNMKIPGFKATLFPYQKEGVRFINKNNGRAIIADEMGLGKTIQALAWLQMHPEASPAVIICPASLKFNWEKEAMKWMTDPKCVILGGRTPYKVDADIYIINYDVLGKTPTKKNPDVNSWCNWFIKNGIKTLILDEAHLIKNNKAIRTKACLKISENVDNIIPLTGTPIENKTSEIFNILHMVAPHIFNNKWTFLMTFCKPKHTGFGWSYDNVPKNKEDAEKWAKATNLLFRKMQNVLIRRKKKDVLKDLPDKLYAFVPLTLTNEAEYDKIEVDFIQYLQDKAVDKAKNDLSDYIDSGVVQFNSDSERTIRTEVADKANPLVKLELLKQIATKGILDEAINWIDNFLDSGKKLVVFASHKFAIEALMEKFGKIAVKIDGSVPTAQRQKNVDAFQNNPKIKLFVGNIVAAGVGITLTSSSNVAFIEYPMAPGQLMQAIDRCHRIGQKNTVNIWFLYAQKPIIENIVTKLQMKQTIIDSTIEGETTEASNFLKDMLVEYKNKKVLK